jgi:YidC/Oxa1 family membrane protein insertase
MSNSPGSNPTGRVTSEQPSFEKRLPLALALMMLVLLVSQYVFKPAPGPKPAVPINDKTAATVANKPAAAPATQVVTQPATPGSSAVQGAAEIITDIDTQLYNIVFTNKGAVVKSWVLKQYRDDTGKPLELINTESTGVQQPFSIEAGLAQMLSIDPNAGLYRAKTSADGNAID